MRRTAYTKLTHWKAQKKRKPLILNGVRQCGKTYLLRTLGEQAFPRYHYVNFENSSAACSLFDDNLDPEHLLAGLSFHLNTAINPETDLLIFDEIQQCPRALTSLKSFHENLPTLAICAAGSLLGIQLKPTSFPVGKVTLQSLYPMSFDEFLLAIDDQKSVDFLAECTTSTTIPQVVHAHLWERLKWYFIVGGLPEIVSIFNTHYRESLYVAFEKVREQQQQLLLNYYADMSKHAGKTNALHLERIWSAVPEQLARSQDSSAHKFKFKDVVPGIDRYPRLASAIDWLIATGLVIHVPIVETIEWPLSAYTADNRFKLYAFDVGLLAAMSGLPPKVILDYEYGTYKGYFAENFVAQALQAQGVPLYSWQRSRAEVEFVCPIGENILPIEVKSGHVTRAKSLLQYADRYRPAYQTIMSANPLHIDTSQSIHRYPLYLAGHFPLPVDT